MSATFQRTYALNDPELDPDLDPDLAIELTSILGLNLAFLFLRTEQPTPSSADAQLAFERANLRSSSIECSASTGWRSGRSPSIS